MDGARPATGEGHGDGTVAEAIAAFLFARGIRRVYGLCGGHIQPLWDAVAGAGIRIVDVRHEAAAVYMAHADAVVTGGVGVALVTAGPGVANTVAAVANAEASRVPVVVLSGRVPEAQRGQGAMQELPQAQLLGAVCRAATELTEPRHVLPSLDTSFEVATGGGGAPPGPVYLDLPADVFDVRLDGGSRDVWLPPRVAGSTMPEPEQVEAAAQLLRGARRPVVVAGRAARGAGAALQELLDATGALYLDTVDSRGAVPLTHPAHVAAMRTRALAEADLVVTVGRRLDFQLGYGSPAVFPAARSFLRIGATAEETSENRRGTVELRGDVARVLDQLNREGIGSRDRDEAWSASLRQEHLARAAALEERLRSEPAGGDGAMHPYRLLAAVRDLVDDDSIVVADGGDILSFARVALTAGRYLDCGPFGCLGVGVPFAIGAAIAAPDRRVIAVIGDGAFGFTAIELDSARRHGAKAVFVIANNGGWNIERMDQLERYAGRTVGVDLPDCRYDLFAASLGVHGERVEHQEDLAPALERAIARAPALVDVAVTRDAVSPDYKSGLATVPTFHAVRPWDDAERLVRATAER